LNSSFPAYGQQISLSLLTGRHDSSQQIPSRLLIAHFPLIVRRSMTDMQQTMCKLPLRRFQLVIFGGRTKRTVSISQTEKQTGGRRKEKGALVQ